MKTIRKIESQVESSSRHKRGDGFKYDRLLTLR